jgi:site-specific recombinase
MEKESPGRLPNGINMIVGNKSREDLINGTHKREAFARELKKMLEERVFDSYNKKQKSTQDIIEVKEVLIAGFVTQSG